MKLTQSGKFLLGQGVYQTIGGEVPSSRVILRSYGQWSANLLALDLLNMSAKSW